MCFCPMSNIFLCYFFSFIEDKYIHLVHFSLRLDPPKKDKEIIVITLTLYKLKVSVLSSIHG